MVSKALAQRTVEVLGSIGEKAKKKAQEDPEACLMSLLDRIEEELPESSATLYESIELFAHDEYLREAKEKIRQHK